MRDDRSTVNGQLGLDRLETEDHAAKRTSALPAVVQETLLHTAPIPFVVVQPAYLKIVNFFSRNGDRALKLAKAHGIDRDEELHNLIFFICFNTFGGLTILWPALLKQINDFSGDFDLQAELRDEVRAAVGGSDLTTTTLDRMPLLQSTIYEVLRIEPPVQSQHGKAKVDFVLETHDEAFQIQAGEMLYGYQPLATRDSKVFDDPEAFKPKRFMGEDGRRLLRHVLWSNGPETSEPFLAEFFLHYDSFKLGDPSILDTSSTYLFTELKKRV